MGKSKVIPLEVHHRHFAVLDDFEARSRPYCSYGGTVKGRIPDGWRRRGGRKGRHIWHASDPCISLGSIANHRNARFSFIQLIVKTDSLEVVLGNGDCGELRVVSA